MTFTDTPAVSNVLAVYNGASADEVRSGLSWYLDAHNVSRTLADTYGVSVEAAAGIIAALSPMNGWENNKRKAAQLLAQGHGEGIGLPANVTKALRIRAGESPLDVLNGDKVTAFYRTILDPTGDIDPVIDRHAFDIAVGERTDDKRRAILGRKGVYSQFANVYRDAAKVAGIGAAQMQAVTWVAWKSAHGIVA